MPVKRKIVTIAFLSLGFIVIAIGIARLMWLLDAFKGKVNSYSVESAYSAIESSVAIIGTSGPTVKYILSRFIPWLRPSFERASTKQASGNAYGTASNANTRRGRSQFGTGKGYDDLDSGSARNEEFEMKGDWGWQQGRDDDAKSDEQRITEENHGIVKSVEWTVQSREESPHVGRKTGGEQVVGQSTSRPAASPASIV